MAGVDVDPITGRPRDPKKTADEKFFLEKKRLEELAGMAGISQSKAAQLVTATIEEALIKRVEDLLNEDAACKTLLEAIRAVGLHELTAAQAVRRLTQRQFTLPQRSAGH
jgi:hypothetical protein